MITEEQRRALFALQEALRLCEGAGVHVDCQEVLGNGIEVNFGNSVWPCFGSLIESDLTKLLREYPE